VILAPSLSLRHGLYSWVRVAGPLAPYARGLAAELVRLGYSSWWAQKQLRLAAHLSGWLDEAGLDATGLDAAAIRDADV